MIFETEIFPPTSELGLTSKKFSLTIKKDNLPLSEK